MARRGRGEIGKSGPVPCTSVNPKKGSSAASPGLANRFSIARGANGSQTKDAKDDGSCLARVETNTSGEAQKKPNIANGQELGTAEDEEDAAEAFDAALSLCSEQPSEASAEALYALFAAAVRRETEARKKREDMEDRCNQLAAENEAVACKLALARGAAERAQATKHGIEKVCREQAQANQYMVEHGKAAAAVEQARMEELQQKFDMAVPNIRDKLAVEADRRKAQREDNDALRLKLEDFVKQAKLSEESFEAQLKPGALRIQIAEAKCHQQEAERRAVEARIDTLKVQVERARAHQAQVAEGTAERERCLDRIQSVVDERKKVADEWTTKVDQLLASKALLERECGVLEEAAVKAEEKRNLEKMVGRLSGLCEQLTIDVENGRQELLVHEAAT